VLLKYSLMFLWFICAEGFEEHFLLVFSSVSLNHVAFMFWATIWICSLMWKRRVRAFIWTQKQKSIVIFFNYWLSIMYKNTCCVQPIANYQLFQESTIAAVLLWRCLIRTRVTTIQWILGIMWRKYLLKLLNDCKAILAVRS